VLTQQDLVKLRLVAVLVVPLEQQAKMVAQAAAVVTVLVLVVIPLVELELLGKVLLEVIAQAHKVTPLVVVVLVLLVLGFKAALACCGATGRTTLAAVQVRQAQL